MDSIKFSIVGCGAHSHLHASAADKIPDIKITSCCDIDSERSARWAERYSCNSYNDIDVMLTAEKPDAVILCTWPNQHLEQIRKCADLGIKNILCEKSLTITGSDADEISVIARDNGILIMEGCMYRHHPAIKKVEDLINAPEMGKVDSVRAAFSNYEPEVHKDSMNTKDWRYRKECGGGVTHDWLSYCVNAVNHFSGSTPVKLFASGSENRDYGVIDRIYGHVAYSNGVAGIVESSKHANFTQMLHVSCEGGIVQLPVAWGIYGEICVYRHHRKEKWGYILTDTFMIEEADSFYLQLKNFRGALVGSEKPGISLDESVKNIHTIESLIKSLHSGEAVSIGE